MSCPRSKSTDPGTSARALRQILTTPRKWYANITSVEWMSRSPLRLARKSLSLPNFSVADSRIPMRSKISSRANGS
jgi:hypothetical protein